METFSKYFLIYLSILIILIGLSYGLIPSKSLPLLYDFEINHLNSFHILRAVMCLYIGIAIHWLFNIVKKRYNIVYGGVLVFMYGLAAGRIISLIFDGIPHWMFVFYLCGELLFGTIALVYLLKYKKKQA